MEKAAKMSSIPEEIHHEILLRSPVKLLLVCKSVCKNWYYLISTSDFVKTHITIQEKKPNLMLKGSLRTSGSRPLYFIDYDSLVSTSIVEDKPIDVIEMDHPFKSLGYDVVQLWGSSNGLICIRVFTFAGYNNLFCLWNPATREFREIPKPPVKFPDAKLHAFGYDHKNDDYKVAIGVQVIGIGTQVQVYTLASDSWKAGKTVPYWFSHKTAGVLFNGDFHWLSEDEDKFLLPSMDISDETFKEMQLSNELSSKDMEEYLFLGVLEGCLCLFVSTDVNGQFEIWEMLDYGVPESWTKCCVIAHESIINQQYFLSLVLSFKNGGIVLLNSNGLVLYDLNNGSARELKINNHPLLNFDNTKNYFGSLVSLNSDTYVGGEDDGRINKNTKKVL